MSKISGKHKNKLLVVNIAHVIIKLTIEYTVLTVICKLTENLYITATLCALFQFLIAFTTVPNVVKILALESDSTWTGAGWLLTQKKELFWYKAFMHYNEEEIIIFSKTKLSYSKKYIINEFELDSFIYIREIIDSLQSEDSEEICEMCTLDNIEIHKELKNKRLSFIMVVYTIIALAGTSLIYAIIHV